MYYDILMIFSIEMIEYQMSVYIIVQQSQNSAPLTLNPGSAAVNKPNQPTELRERLYTWI